MNDLKQVIDHLASGTTTSHQLVQDCLATIQASNPTLNALLQIYADEALTEAKKSDERRANNTTKSPLDGVPVVIKANFSHQDHPTTAASKMLEDYVSPYDATVVKKLKDGGAIIIASANMDEFAMGSSGENSAFGPTKNPLDNRRVPGGSSSGSAVSVASGMAPLSYGSDTGGSIRLPAAYCGIVGLKPTYGAVSRYGLLAMASSLDQIGPFASTVEGVKIGFESVRGLDHMDSTSREFPTDTLSKQTFTIGVPKQFTEHIHDNRISEALELAIKKLEAAGHTVKRDIDLPILEESIAIYYVICPAEVSANLARYDGIRFGLHGADVVDSRTRGLGNEVKRRIMLGTYVLSAGYADQFYKRAQAALETMKHDLTHAMDGVDMLLGPTSANLPFMLGEKADPLAMYLEDLFTIPANLTGRPAMSVPAATVEEDGHKLSIGLQLLGNPWKEEELFTVGKLIEVPHHA